jgi:putative tryptophan/tyrosine transport system substrate-binding protein
MRRREFISLLGSSVVALPSNGSAKEQRTDRIIGLLMYTNQDDREYGEYVNSFRIELSKFGWNEGENIRIESRWGASSNDIAKDLALQLVNLNPDIIVSQNTPTTAALLNLTHSIPIIFANLSDPVAGGFVAELSRPGGNVTGFVNLEPSLAGKLLELLKEIAPKVTRVWYLHNPNTATYSYNYLRYLQAAADSAGVEALPAPVKDGLEITDAISSFARDPNSGIIVMPDAFAVTHREQITSLATKYRLPGIYPFRFFAEGGGLASYGSSVADTYRRIASYVDRILRGEKPGDLPVQAPVKFELVINLKTARAIGIEPSFTLLARADEVIE